jgi:hypothetical protein
LRLRKLLGRKWLTAAGRKRTEGSEGVLDPGGNMHTSIQPDLRVSVRLQRKASRCQSSTSRWASTISR